MTAGTLADVKILAVSGSLRGGSSNTTLLRAAAQLAPDGVTVTLFDGIGDLPHFNPDLDSDEPLPAVARWRQALNDADAVLISCPEYAHGVPGVMKNALDWIVSSGEFMNKPVALLNASPRSVYAQAQLVETLTVMMAAVVHNACRALTLATNKLNESALMSDPETADSLRSSLAALAAYARDPDASVEGFISCPG